MTEQSHAALGIHGLDAAGDDPAESLKRRQIVRRAKIITVVVLILLALGAGRTVFMRIANARALEAGTAEHALQYVKTTLAKNGDARQTLALPGTLQGRQQAPIAARASGYLKRWTKDIGASVAKGELLAEIETPEIDQQLSQAVAARQQAAAGLDLAKSTLTRWEGLRKKDVVSQQELDERRSGATQAGANLAAAEANVQRLRQTEGFKRIVAPFAGVITRRNVDVGDLIDAGGGTSRALFILTQADALRVYVNVPQSYAQLIKPGQQVVVTQSELADRQFTGTVARTGASIDAATRTMQVEIALPNPDNALLPGAYVQVQLLLKSASSMAIPANALLIRAEGIRVAVVDPNGVVALRAVKIGRNLGESVEVVDGVKPADVLVLNPSDSLADGDRVAIAPPPAKAGAAAAKEAP
ncbi:MAG: efflux RND transporter periplasmic adaptor subunit [Pseudomonadota bacterium]